MEPASENQFIEVCPVCQKKFDRRDLKEVYKHANHPVDYEPE